MGDLFSKHKLIAFGVLGIIVALIAWYALSSGQTPTTSLLTTEATQDASNASDKNLVETLLTLRAVTLSGTILSDPAFTALRDFGTGRAGDLDTAYDPTIPIRHICAPVGASALWRPLQRAIRTHPTGERR